LYSRTTKRLMTDHSGRSINCFTFVTVIHFQPYFIYLF
jgi:hypothetical protein